jgi:DNA recombination-dependent growth factor C
MITKRKELQRHVPFSDRVFDLKRRFLKFLNKPLEFWSKIRLFIGPWFADDESYIDKLGLTDDCKIRVNLLQEAVVRCYFRDLETKDHDISCLADRTFGSVASQRCGRR